MLSVMFIATFIFLSGESSDCAYVAADCTNNRSKNTFFIYLCNWLNIKQAVLNMPRTIITGTGCYIPPYVQSNQDFANHVFYSQDQQPLTTEPGEVVNKF